MAKNNDNRTAGPTSTNMGEDLAEAQITSLQERAKAEKQAVEAVKKEDPAKAYRVADGKSITSNRGILGPKSIVTALDFVRDSSKADVGELRMMELHEKGYLVKSK